MLIDKPTKNAMRIKGFHVIDTLNYSFSTDSTKLYCFSSPSNHICQF